MTGDWERWLDFFADAIGTSATQAVATAASLAAASGLTAATVNKTLVHLERVGVVSETTSRLRGRVFASTDCVALLNAELDVTPAPKARRPRQARLR